MTYTINLQQFCGKEAYNRKRGFDRPFSDGSFTWATNGHIAVRVPMVAEYAGNKSKVDIGKLVKVLDDFSGAMTLMSLFSLPDFTPETRREDCVMRMSLR